MCLSTTTTESGIRLRCWTASARSDGTVKTGKVSDPEPLAKSSFKAFALEKILGLSSGDVGVVDGYEKCRYPF